MGRALNVELKTRLLVDRVGILELLSRQSRGKLLLQVDG
jgi:hypothetical protein